MCLFSFLIAHFAPLPFFNCIISIVKVRKTLMLFFCFCPCYIGVIKSAIKCTYCSPNTFCSHLVLQDHELPSPVFFFFFIILFQGSPPASFISALLQKHRPPKTVHLCPCITRSSLFHTALLLLLFIFVYFFYLYFILIP